MVAGRGNESQPGTGLVRGPASESEAPLPAQSVNGCPPVRRVQSAAVAMLAGRAALVYRAGGGSLLEGFAAVTDPRSK